MTQFSEECTTNKYSGCTCGTVCLSMKKWSREERSNGVERKEEGGRREGRVVEEKGGDQERRGERRGGERGV